MARRIIGSNKRPELEKRPSIPAPRVMPNGKLQQEVLNCIHNKGATGLLVGS